MKKVLLFLIIVWSALVRNAYAQDTAGPYSAVYMGSTPCTWSTGSGAPESSVTGAVCDEYEDSATGYKYQKLSGSGNTGWSRIAGYNIQNTWTVYHVFSMANPDINFFETDASSGNKAWRFNFDNACFTFDTMNDAMSSVTAQLMTTCRSGAFTFLASVTTPIVNATTGFQVGGAAASGKILIGNSANYVASTPTYPNSATNTDYLKGDGTNIVLAAPAALTKTDDTNVTLTLGGSATTALLNTASLTLGWTNQLSVARGGTGDATLTANGLLYGNGTGAVGITAQGGAHTVAVANAGAPSWTTNPEVGSVTVDAGNTGTNNFVSQATGWLGTYAGAWDVRYLYTDELRAKLFTADMEAVLAGSREVTKSFSTISQTFTCPSKTGGGNTATLWVNDAPTYGDAAVFISGDSIVIHALSRVAFGPFSIDDCVGVVTGYADGSGANAGQQSWTFTRYTTNNWGGAMVAGTTVAVNQLAVDYGTTGNGIVYDTAVDGAASVNAPYTDIRTWTDAPVPVNFTTRCRLGNQNGITSVAEYGLLCGSFSGNAYVRFTDQNAEIVGIPLILKSGSTVTMKLDPSVPSFALGATLPSAYGTGTGCWMGNDSGTYKARCGVPGGAGFFWDGSAFSINGALTAITGTIGGFTLSSTELYAGSGAARVEMQSTAGFWAGATLQASAPFSVTEAGALKAISGAIGGFNLGADYIRDAANSMGMASTITGGDDVRFWAGDTFANRATAPIHIFESGTLVIGNLAADSNGVRVSVPTAGAVAATSAYRFTPSSIAGSTFGIYGYEDGGTTRSIEINNTTTGGTNQAYLVLTAQGNSGGHVASIRLAGRGNSYGDILIGTDGGSQVFMSSTFDVQFGNFTVGGSQFTVDNSNGNTAVAGTFGAAGATTLSSTLNVAGKTTISYNDPVLSLNDTTSGADMQLRSAGSQLITRDNGRGDFIYANATGSGVVDSATLDVVTAVTGAFNSAFLKVTRGDSANGYAQLGYCIGATCRYSLGTRAGSTGWGLYDETASAQRLLIDTSGNVGIGMTPSAGLDITHNGSAVAIHTAAGNNALEIWNSSLSSKYWVVSPESNGSNTDLGFYDLGGGGGGYRLYLQTGGNVGIGTSSPTHLLQLGADDAAKPTSSTWTIVSDRRAKTNITDAVNVVTQMRQVKIHEFDYTGAYGLPKAHSIGPIAQEIQTIFPRSVTPTTVASRPAVIDAKSGVVTPAIVGGDVLTFNPHEMFMANVAYTQFLDAEIAAILSVLNPAQCKAANVAAGMTLACKVN